MAADIEFGLLPSQGESCLQPWHKNQDALVTQTSATKMVQVKAAMHLRGRKLKASSQMDTTGKTNRLASNSSGDKRVCIMKTCLFARA